MKKLLTVLLFCVPFSSKAQTIGFTAPDTVCVNAPVQLQNTSVGVASSFWNFCSGTGYDWPGLESIGNPGGALLQPVFTVIGEQNGNYYVFVVSNQNRTLTRLDFGNSLLNTPVANQLLNQLPPGGAGIQLVQDATGYHLIITGGMVAQGSRIVRVDLGANLNNPAPVYNDWGNLGNLAYPSDLYTFEEGGRHYGFTCNFDNNTITRFDFGADFSVPPAAVNLGNIGNSLDRPAGLQVIKDNGTWYVFVVNENSNTLVRLNFGNSLLNMPVAENLGTLNNVLRSPRDISFIIECGQTIAIVVNGNNRGTNSICRLAFPAGPGGAVFGTDLGNPNMVLNFGSSISSFFRVGNDLYAFIPNVVTGALSRISFRSCSGASIPPFNGLAPPVFSYGGPGIYTVNLITDEGTATQQSFCRTIVVIDSPTVELGADAVSCDGIQITLDAGVGAGPQVAPRYAWSTGADTRTITTGTAGNYSVVVTNGGCSVTDNVNLAFPPAFTASSVITSIDCINPTGSAEIRSTGTGAPFTYSLNNGPAQNSPNFTGLAAGNYSVTVTDLGGCKAVHNFSILEDAASVLRTDHTRSNPSCSYATDGAITMLVTRGTGPFEYALGTGPFGTNNVFPSLPAGTYKLYVRNPGCIDSQEVVLTGPPPIEGPLSIVNERCNNGAGSATIAASGGVPPYTFTWDGVASNSPRLTGLTAGDYVVTISDANGCRMSQQYHIAHESAPPVNIVNNDTTINIGTSITLHAEGAPDYRWDMEPSLSCLDCASPVASPTRNTEYVVRTVTGVNCVRTDRVTVRVTFNRTFNMPNAFSPNKDGVNDVFRPKSQGVIAFAMQIYNRWGELLAQVSDIQKGWDGTSKGKPQPAGTYLYMVQYILWDREGKMVVQDKRGTFTLIR